MPKPEHLSCQPKGIAELDPTFREKDGVVFDADSYKRHCTHSPEGTPPRNTTPEPHPPGVFLTDPVHIGWYETTDPVIYPIMGGIVTRPCGSGSGSWLSSYLSSYLTSYMHSYGSYLTSGSWFSSGSGVLCGGYGLDLI